MQITHLFVDVGGVLLTNGWDTALRKQTAEHFGFDVAEIEDRIRDSLVVYELGRIGAREFLDFVVFHKPRSFTHEQILEYILSAARAYSETIDLIKRLKSRYGLTVVAISNEGRELAIDRVTRFDLCGYIDFFAFSSFVHLRKPDPAIYRLAMDVSQARPEHSVYIDDRPLLVQAAETVGIPTIRHKDADTTRQALAQLGLDLQNGRWPGARRRVRAALAAQKPGLDGSL
ncbi:MAG TPA: HAD-IA family hydrolase [Planctomycetota bacterium]|jgi:putative hydrolase of the HAD superfamily